MLFQEAETAKMQTRRHHMIYLVYRCFHSNKSRSNMFPIYQKSSSGSDNYYSLDRIQSQNERAHKPGKQDCSCIVQINIWEIKSNERDPIDIIWIWPNVLESSITSTERTIKWSIQKKEWQSKYQWSQLQYKLFASDREDLEYELWKEWCQH